MAWKSVEPFAQKTRKYRTGDQVKGEFSMFERELSKMTDAKHAFAASRSTLPRFFALRNLAWKSVDSFAQTLENDKMRQR